MKLRDLLSIYLFVLFFTQLPTTVVAAKTQSVYSCNSFYLNKEPQSVTLAKNNLEKYELIFQRSRGINSYKNALGPWFQKALENISHHGGNWLDAGAGEGVAVQEFLQQHNANTNINATIVSLQSSAKKAPNLEVLTGQLIEDIPLNYFKKYKLITDVYGALAYSASPHLVLKKYLEVLEANGEILIYLGARDDIYGKTNLVIDRKKEILSFYQWLQEIPGTKAELLVDKRIDEMFEFDVMSIRITKSTTTEVVTIPKLTVTNFKPGTPPQFIFTEVQNGKNNSSELHNLFKEKVKQATSEALEQKNITQFLDSFRSGEITHPLIKEINSLSKNSTWLNVSDFSERFYQDLQNRLYDFTSTNVFWGISQKWINFRISRIDTNDFKYRGVKNFEDMDAIQNVSLITDYYGDFLKELTPDVILQKYVDTLSRDGTILIFLGSEHGGFGSSHGVILKNGENYSLRGWLLNQPDLKVKLHRGGHAWSGGEWNFVKIKKRVEAPIITKLNLIGFGKNSKTEIPKVYYQEE
jgi:SAM-dependent methyltransferase